MHHARGFTLIELMITLVIGSILLGVAVPNMRLFVQNAKLTTRVNELVADINYARSEAVKRGGRVVICQSANPTANPPSCGGSGNWASGRIIFVDVPTGTPATVYNGTYSTADNDVLLRIRPNYETSTDTLTAILTSTSAAVGSVVFLRTGAANIDGTDAISLRVCDQRGSSKGKSITIGATGRPSTSTTGAC